MKFSALLLLCVGGLSGFTSCSSGSDSPNPTNVDPGPVDGGSGLTYSGPPPATEDVREFKLNLWDKLVADNRCGGCHKQGGSGIGFFVRDDDVNLAYSAALNIVDKSIPANSRMVTKVGGGHNCWESDPMACADIITGWITDWANATGGVANEVTLTAPTFHAVQDSRTFPADVDQTDFVSSGLYDLLRDNCSRCHSENASTPQSPFFASDDVAKAYSEARDKIDLADYDRSLASPPESSRSRFIVRLRDEFHNCWSDCASNADAMEAAVLAFAGAIPVTEVDEDLLTSGAMTLLGDGIVASSGGRIESDVIALYTFKPPSNDSVGQSIGEVIDVSGVGSSVNLRAFGDSVTWVGGWGARIESGRLQGGADKLYELITLTGEYSVEAWVIPANVVQDDFARIVTYAGGGLTGNNFALSQSAYNYDFLHRNSNTNADGMPAFSTPDDAQVVQASLQHVVVTYDGISGRRIFVNGQEIAGSDPQAGGNLASWDNSFALALGQNAGGGDQWQGTVRLLAIHNRAMSGEEIANNFSVGVGEKFYLLFDLSRAGLVDMPEAYIVFEVEQYDSYAYLFKNPFFISLDSSATPGSIPIQGMRIGLNGRELEAGQAYAKLNAMVSDAAYSPAGQTLSSFGTIIPLENGPELDQFFLTFDRIGDQVYARAEPEAPPALLPSIVSEEQSLTGVRHFEEINAALAQMTGIPRSNEKVAQVYSAVRQQLPQSEEIAGFLPAHQMGMTQLAVAYCSELASNSEGNRAAFFSGFGNWSDPSPTTFGTPGSRNVSTRDAILEPILQQLAAHTFSAHDGLPAAHLETQPDPANVKTELNNLIDRLVVGTEEVSPSPSSTVEVVTSVCAAAMGSALLMIQ